MRSFRSIAVSALALTLTIVSILLAGILIDSHLNIADGAEDSAIGDIVFSDKADSMKDVGVGPVVFPHATHEEAIECADCHPTIFKDKIGSNDISMKKNMEGEFCGSTKCHCGMLDCYDYEATFPLYMCDNCHTGIEEAKEQP